MWVTSPTMERRSASHSSAHRLSIVREETGPCGRPATAECGSGDSFAERNRCAGGMRCRYYIKTLCCPYVRRLPAVIAGSAKRRATASSTSCAPPSRRGSSVVLHARVVSRKTLPKPYLTLIGMHAENLAQTLPRMSASRSRCHTRMVQQGFRHRHRGVQPHLLARRRHHGRLRWRRMPRPTPRSSSRREDRVTLDEAVNINVCG